MIIDIDIQALFASGVHFGHGTPFSHSEMLKYVHSEKNGLQIIDITKTAEKMSQALVFLNQVIRSGGRVVIVATKPAAQELVRKHGEEMGMPFVDQRWLGGTLTNFKTVRQSVSRLDQLNKRFEEGKLEGLTKKERLILQRERAKLTVNLGGIQDLDSLPEALFVIDVAQEKNAILEANKLGIPVIGVVDTNCSPQGVDYVIPGNDDALSAIEYYLECVGTVVKSAHAEFSKEQEKVASRNKPVIKKAAVKKAVEEPKEEEAEAPKKVVKKVVKKQAAEVAEEAPKKVVKKVAKKAEAAEESKPAAKKPAAKKPAAKKPAEEKAADAKKPAAKKTAAKKPAAKKTVAKKSTEE